VHVLARGRVQAACANRIQKSRRGAVEQLLGRYLRRQAQRDFNRMALVGADLRAIGTDRKPLLVALRNDGFDLGPA